jgi:D-glycero-D-manno-heptose 1,7-bisphosphate phosphatase
LTPPRDTIPRPAVFFDRDGTLTVDSGYVHRPEDLVFVPGAIAAVKRVNDLGYYAFLVTNQSGVARGYFSEADVQAFHDHLEQQLHAAGARLDDIRYCPYLEGGTIEAYARPSDWRKPAPGMLLDLMRVWPVAAARSLVVGDKDIDVQAAAAAGLRGLRFTDGDLDRFLAPHLAS